MESSSTPGTVSTGAGPRAVRSRPAERPNVRLGDEMVRVMAELAGSIAAAYRLLDDPDVDATARRIMGRLVSAAGDLAAAADAPDDRSDEGSDDAEDDGSVAPDDVLAEVAAARLDRKIAAADRAAAAVDRAEAARDREAAAFDELTGALRRGPGLAALQREIDRCHRTDGRLIVGFADVDGLKATNDHHGHIAGDALLRRVGIVLRRHTRSYDLVVRYGGDEFLIVLVGADADPAVDRIAADLALLDGPDGPASASVGFAELQPDDTIETVVARADASLYRCRAHDRAHAHAHGA